MIGSKPWQRLKRKLLMNECFRSQTPDKCNASLSSLVRLNSCEKYFQMRLPVVFAVWRCTILHDMCIWTIRLPVIKMICMFACSFFCPWNYNSLYTWKVVLIKVSCTYGRWQTVCLKWQALQWKLILLRLLGKIFKTFPQHTLLFSVFSLSVRAVDLTIAWNLISAKPKNLWNVKNH